MTSHWLRKSRQVIQQVHAALPETATYDDRAKALEAAYPFGERKMWPYKQWLKARRQYLARYQDTGKPAGGLL